MKKILFALAIVGLVACACASFAQGAFVDVPTDHWAYDAVNQLQRVGIIVGYPDGTFGGKRAMTRYEFAVAIARLLPLIDGDTVITKDVDLSGYAKKSDIPAFNGASKADLEALKKLVNEFGDELASLGVDVDALKRDVANLTARVEALEAENRRIRFTGDFFAGAVAARGNGFDIDGRDLNPAGPLANPDNNLLENVTVYKNFDLNIVGRASDKVTVYSTINYGDYLNEYAGLTDDDDFYPTFLYAVADMGKTTITVGRFPMQWTPLTIKSTDYDSYINYSVTDNGDYALDGIKADLAFGKAFNLSMFAAKNDQNRYLMDDFYTIPGWGKSGATQSAGARAAFNLGKVALGASYLETWWNGFAYDKDKIYSADVKIPFGSFLLAGEYAKRKEPGNVLNSNEAWEASLGYGCCSDSKLAIKAGYREVGDDFWSAGSWTRVGDAFNPTNIKGWFADAKYDFGKSFGIYGGFQNYSEKDLFVTGPEDLKSVKGGLNIGLGNGTLQAEYEKVKDANVAYRWFNGAPKSTYWTFAYNYKFNPQANLRFGYQMIKDDYGMGAKDKGGVAFAQFCVSF